MRGTNRRKKRIGLLCGLFVVMLLCFVKCGETVLAAKENFDIDVTVLPIGGESTYNISVTVQNNGADWEGTARFLIENGYQSSSAYDTDLTLPQGSRKQFIVRVPLNSTYDVQRTAYIQLLDRHQKETAFWEFPQLLVNGTNILRMGILSDTYASLTYLDMGGEELYYYGSYFPLKLEELDQDHLRERLDSLTILVIDHYNTEVLSQDDMTALWDWVDAGGCLILGTGAYAEDTLGGFDLDALGLELISVYSPETQTTDNKIWDYSAVDTQRLSLAQIRLLDNYSCSEIYYSESLTCLQYSLGDGDIAILPYALTELGALDASAFGSGGRTEYVSRMLDMASAGAEIRYNGNFNNYDVSYTMNNLFGMLGGSDSNLKFGVLKLIVILYVIFVGPVLYLVLKLLKKRELYWAAVPVAALMGIGIVYLAGVGFKVRDTRVCSVVLEDISGCTEKEAYLQCYDARHSEWRLKLADEYAYVGSMGNDSSYHYEEDVRKYYYHIQKDGNGLFFGINPDSSFENAYFTAGGASAGQSHGSVDLSDVEADFFQGPIGRVTNETAYDFPCFAVIAYGTMYVYEDLPAGESRELSMLTPVYEDAPIYNTYYGSYTYRLRNDLNAGGEARERAAAQAALGVGLCAAAKRADDAEIFFMGVTRDYEKVVDDICQEVSYGCLYAVR